MKTQTKYVARTDDLVVQELGAELLVYDRRAEIAHCLTGPAASVWLGCRDGASQEALIDQCRDLPGTGEERAELISAALAELSDKDLLEFPSAELIGATRRQVVRRMAGVGAAAFAAPMVISAVVKTPYAAAYAACTPIYQPCVVGGAKCCTGLTCSNGLPGSKNQTYCAQPGCTPKGSYPIVNGKTANCNASSGTHSNSLLCCSGTCSASDKHVCG